jgi:hypothetical protein
MAAAAQVTSLVLPQLDVLTLGPSFVNDYNFQLVSLHILHVLDQHNGVHQIETNTQFLQ